MSGRESRLIIAHRGDKVLAPENTIAAFNGAIDAGAQWVEIDVQETADGAVIVHHDQDFMKTSGVSLRIREATLEELRGHDAILLGAIAAILSYAAVTLIERAVIPWYFHIHDVPE